MEIKYEKYQTLKESKEIKEISKQERELEKKAFKIVLTLKNAKGEIVDKIETTSIAESNSKKYSMYERKQIANEEVIAKLRELNKKRREIAIQENIERKKQLIKDLADKYQVNFDFMEKLINLALRKNAAFYRFNNEKNLNDCFNISDYYSEDLYLHEHVFDLIVELADIEIEYYRLTH